MSTPPEDSDTPTTAVKMETNLSVKDANGKKRKAGTTTVKTTKRARKGTAKDEPNGTVDASAAVEEDTNAKSKKRAPRKKVKVEEETVEDVQVEEGEDGTKVRTKQKRQRKTKEKNVAPLEERTVGSKLRVGAHVSIAGGK